MNQFKACRLTRSAGFLAATTVVAGIAATATTGVASAAPQTHTLRLAAKQIGSKQVGQREAIGADRLRRNGTTVGFDASDCVFDFATSKATCDVAVSLQRGMLRARVTVDQNNSGSGSVIGGTRHFRDATGTVTTAPGSGPGLLLVTIRYAT
jgi:hypothetical protein